MEKKKAVAEETTLKGLEGDPQTPAATKKYAQYGNDSVLRLFSIYHTKKMSQGTDNVFTLTFICEGQRVLLAMKKRGFGVGRWNGLGGKVEKGESLEHAARREAAEEAGVEVGTLELVGQLTFVFPDKELLVCVFLSRNFSGVPRETEEMRPQWFSIEEIPYGAMWEDDRYWLPLVFEGRRFQGRFVFDTMEHVIEHEVKIL